MVVKSPEENPTSVPSGHLSTDKVPAFVTDGWPSWYLAPVMELRSLMILRSSFSFP